MRVKELGTRPAPVTIRDIHIPVDKGSEIGDQLLLRAVRLGISGEQDYAFFDQSVRI